MNNVKIFTNGLVKENPLLVLMIGLCSSLAVTTSTVNGIGMGVSMTFVLLMSEIVISLFRRLIPNSIRIPVFIIVIAAFTTVIDYVLKAYFPDLSGALGVFIPLIVVNCIIMGRVESFASKQPIGRVILDSLGMGLGYTWVLVGISVVRELLGNGTLFSVKLLPVKTLFFTMPSGGFFVFAVFIAINLAFKKAGETAASGDKTCAGCGAAGCGCAAGESADNKAAGHEVSAGRKASAAADTAQGAKA